MGYLKIHCDYCGGTWEVYHRDNWNSDKARQCPHCYKSIDRQTWVRQILPALGALNDANMELVKDSTGYRAPLFSVDYIADTIFANANKGESAE